MTKGTKQLLLVAGAAVAVYFLFFKEKKEVGASIQLGSLDAGVSADLDSKSENFEDGFSRMGGFTPSDHSNTF